MADALRFSLVSPERELFAGEADTVLVPGTEGLFEVQANHAPVMSTLSPGLLVIRKEGSEQKYYVRGGFADVTSGSLTVLAEVAIAEKDLTGERLAEEKQLAQAQLADASLEPEEQINAHRAADLLKAY